MSKSRKPKIAEAVEVEEPIVPLEGVLDAIDGLELAPEQEEVKPEIIPNINSPEWTPFVISKLLEDEMYDGLITIDGLRRITNEYIGEVIGSTTEVNQAPNAQNGHHAAVTHTLVVLGHDGITRTVSGAADVFEGNGDDPSFSWRYATATCETRAESRAYRRLLRLRHLVAAEEMSQVPEDQSGMTGVITDRQINFIDMICKRLNMDAMAYINSGKNKYESVRDVPYDVGVRMSGFLSVLQQKPKEIAQNLRGYKIGWMKN